MTLGLIIVNEDPEAAVHWAVGEEGDLKATGSVATLSDVPTSVRDAESLMAILPGHMGATRRLTLPVKGEKALEDAARLSFEDVLAEPVEDFHFAFGPLEEDGTRMVSAVPIDWLTAWMDHLKEAELDPDHVTLDHLAIHIDEHPLVVLHQAHQVAASLKEGGVTGDPQFIQMLVDPITDGQKVLTVGVGASSPSFDIVLKDTKALSAFYLKGVAGRQLASFRKGIFAKRRDWSGLFRHWRVAGGLMAACVGVWVVGLVLDGVRHGRAADQLMRQSTENFAMAFPDTTIRDLRRQASQRAGGVGGASLFLPLSADLAAAIEENEAVQLTGLRFSLDGELVADLTFSDAVALEQLQRDLEARDVPTREGANLRREANGQYSGQLYLGEI